MNRERIVKNKLTDLFSVSAMSGSIMIFRSQHAAPVQVHKINAENATRKREQEEYARYATTASNKSLQRVSVSISQICLRIVWSGIRINVWSVMQDTHSINRKELVQIALFGPIQTQLGTALSVIKETAWNANKMVHVKL